MPLSSHILLDKPEGISSFAALYPIKKALGTKKVGHTGTLDPFASGLLVVLIGGALKLSSWICAHEKRYTAEISFGAETDTLDHTGHVIENAPLPNIDALNAALSKFRGGFLQTPPQYSAIHIDGKRAYELAREGKPVSLSPRQVTVFELALDNVTTNMAGAVERTAISARCSSGTYIRALARDIAIAAGSRGHLVKLRRTHVGNFGVDNALSGANARADAGAVIAACRHIDENFFVLAGIPNEVKEKYAGKFF